MWENIIKRIMKIEVYPLSHADSGEVGAGSRGGN